MAIPSIKTLSAVFSEPKKAREILELTRARLLELPAGAERARGCYNPPPTYDIRLHCLNAIDRGLHGVESIESTAGQYADYLNTGDTYAPTVIYWRGAYRVQSIGDFIEIMSRQRVNFR